MIAPLNARFTVGKNLIALSTPSSGVGAFVADWNKTHLLNPAWPPHARFRDAQTTSLAAGLATATLAGLWRPADTAAEARRSLGLTGGIAAMRWVSNLTASAPPPGPWTRPRRPRSPS